MSAAEQSTNESTTRMKKISTQLNSAVESVTEEVCKNLIEKSARKPVEEISAQLNETDDPTETRDRLDRDT